MKANEQYETEVNKRGGIRAVAEKLQISHDSIWKRVAGISKVRPIDITLINTVPVVDGWETLLRLKTDGVFREGYHSQAKDETDSDKRRFMFGLLQLANDSLPGYSKFLNKPKSTTSGKKAKFVK